MEFPKVQVDASFNVDYEHSTTSITSERKQEIIRTIWKALPIIAEQRRELIRKNAEFAKLCIFDAFQGRLSNGLANNSKKSKWIYTIFCIQTSEYLLNTVLIACALHTFCLFIEVPNTCSNSFLLKFFQFCIYLIYAVDIMLKMGYEGVEEYLKHDWQRLYAINAALGFLDLFAVGCTCYTNPLRPLAGLLRSRKGRKFFDILKKMLPGVLHNLIPIFFFVIVVMIFGNIFFDDYVEQFRHIPSIFYNWLYLILTNDTFDRLLPENLLLNLAYLMFFFPAIYIGQRFLLNLIIGDTYDTFRSFVKKQLKKEKLKEIQGLAKAFAVLDDRKTGYITATVWNECIRSLHPELSYEAIALYFEMISGGSNNISVLQFLSLKNVLNFKMSYHNKKDYSNRVIDTIKSLVVEPVEFLLKHFGSIVGRYITDAQVSASEKLLEITQNYSLWERINTTDLIALFMGWDDLILWKSEKLNASFSVGQCLILCHVAEFLLRLVAMKGSINKLMEENNLISFAYVFGCIGTILIYPFYSSLADYSYSLQLPFLLFKVTASKVLLLVRLLRCSRIVNMNEDLDNFSSSLLDILPSLLETFTFTFIVSYMFGALGHQLLGTMSEWKSPVLAIVKAQQLTFMVGFLSSMEEAMEEVHPMVMFYFLFFLVTSLTVSNIALSIIIDLHSNLLIKNTPKERENEREKIDIMFNKLVSHARARKLFSGCKNLNFKNIKMSSFQTSDARKYITNNEQETINLKDLEACQKYASIPLIEFYHKTHKSEKNVQQEIDLLKAIKDLHIHQEPSFSLNEVIFNEKDTANKLYILISGSVVLSRSDGRNSPFSPVSPVHGNVDEIILNATHFLGLESFLPSSTHSISAGYSYGCVAQQDAKLLVIAQDDLLQKTDAEFLGPLLKSALNTSNEIEQLFASYRKRSMRMSLLRRRSVTSISRNLSSESIGFIQSILQTHSTSSLIPKEAVSNEQNNSVDPYLVRVKSQQAEVKFSEELADLSCQWRTTTEEKVPGEETNTLPSKSLASVFSTIEISENMNTVIDDSQHQSFITNT